MFAPTGYTEQGYTAPRFDSNTTLDSICADLKKLEESRHTIGEQQSPALPPIVVGPALSRIVREAKIVDLEGELNAQKRALEGAYASMQVLEDSLIDSDQLQKDLHIRTAALEAVTAALTSEEQKVRDRDDTIERLNQQLYNRVGTLEDQLGARVAAFLDEADQVEGQLITECTRVKLLEGKLEGLEGRLAETEQKLVIAEDEVCELKFEMVKANALSLEQNADSLNEERERLLGIRVQELEHLLNTRDSDAEAARQAHAQALQCEKQLAEGLRIKLKVQLAADEAKQQLAARIAKLSQQRTARERENTKGSAS